jgi:hypothetical protein
VYKKRGGKKLECIRAFVEPRRGATPEQCCGLSCILQVVSTSMVAPAQAGAGPRLLDSFVLDNVEDFPAFTDHAPIGALVALGSTGS